uniref:Rx N-terminal domain-containing protein n=1 Tax=Leersia perrieri TaxID=77586 RepID=A0A0D9XZM2_9ORYZ
MASFLSFYVLLYEVGLAEAVASIVSWLERLNRLTQLYEQLEVAKARLDEEMDKLDIIPKLYGSRWTDEAIFLRA